MISIVVITFNRLNLINIAKISFPGPPIRKQPLESKGPIVFGDEAWMVSM
jgi:hypothetical protein